MSRWHAGLRLHKQKLRPSGLSKATLEGVGQPALVPALTGPAVYESNMMRLRVDTSRIVSRLLFEILRQARVRSEIVRTAHLSNQASVNQAGLNPVGIGRPERSEQNEIVRCIDDHDRTVDVMVDQERKLQRLRLGLKSDLLKGRVPVPEAINIGA